ncbi:MAG: type B 50S ribosomal protein L31 [Candidatus Micrarchaeia archaeon]
MKKDIHPKDYRLVAFRDITNGFTFITRSTAKSKETVTIDGVEYPLVKLEISSASHGFFTGQKKTVHATGRVDKFRRKYGNIGEKNN